jgi:uncharacterized damage-inducible protein DinB
MTVDEARLHLRYHGWASRKLFDAALTLSPETLSREMGVSHKSVLETLGHILFADRIWLSRVVDPSIQMNSSTPLQQALEKDWPVIQKRWEDWADSLADADLLTPVSYKTLKGDSFQSPPWQVVLHLVNHGTYHRGQVAAMLKQLGAPLPPTDLIFYYREGNS